MDKAIKEFLNLPSPVTAIVTSSDKIASRVLRLLKNRGLKIPDEIAVTGYNNEDLALATDPQLTTMEIPLEKLGKRATGILLRLISGEKFEGPHPMLEPELLVRDSA